MGSERYRRVSTMDYISSAVLASALSLGMYIQWLQSHNTLMLLMTLAPLTLSVLSILCACYMTLSSFWSCLHRLYTGFLLGLVALTAEDENHEDGYVDGYIDLMNGLFVTSLVLQCLWIIARRCLHLNKDQKVSMMSLEFMEMIGVVMASVATGNDVILFSLVILSFGLTVGLIRLRSTLGCLSQVIFIAMCVRIIFPRLFELSLNRYALVVFVGHITFDALLDLFFSEMSVLQCWYPILTLSSWKRRLIIFSIATAQLTFFGMCANLIPHHKEKFIVVPLFSFFAFLWFIYHFMFLASVWKLSNKLTESNAACKHEDRGSFFRFLEAQGVRHYSLLSWRLASISFVTSVLIGLFHWTTRSTLSMSIWLLTVPLELGVISLYWELGAQLGGSCIGYAWITPAKYADRVNAGPSLCHTDVTTDRQATHIPHLLHHFFSLHKLINHGCDFIPSPRPLIEVRAKLTEFFRQKMDDGPRYDTYLLYYSGPVYENGDWALLNGERLSYDDLSEMWRSIDPSCASRLILILDTQHSHLWSPLVTATRQSHIALQTSLIHPGLDPDLYINLKLGQFTEDWLEYNTTNTKQINWSQDSNVLIPTFTVSKSWYNFSFHQPTLDEINLHWRNNFPRLPWCLVVVTNCPIRCPMCSSCFIVRCLKHIQLMLFSSSIYDTGHGFKLVRR